MSIYEEGYKKLVEQVITGGEERPSRVGNTMQLFGTVFSTDCMKFNQFPILTSRKMFLKPILGELAAFLRGTTALRQFKDMGCDYWDANAQAWGRNRDRPQEDQDVGLIYGYQWRKWDSHIDQLQQVIDEIKENPFSRRHIISAWNPSDLDHMCLPPCHIMYQFNVDVEQKYLDILVYMRSVDLCLGLPSDVVLYASLLILVCQETGLKPGVITFVMGDTHVYSNHYNKWMEYMAVPHAVAPSWKLDRRATINNFIPEYLQLEGYEHGPAIKFPLNV